MLKQSDHPFDLEPHYVESEDGYILTLFRLKSRDETIKNKLTESNETKKRPSVLICHGLMCSGTEWLCQSPKKSLPYLLGYDCWIACQRGSRLTGPKPHVKLSTQDSEYWDFGPDEIGYYDIPAFIDYILKETGEKSIFYVGHSLGTAVLFILLSSKPEYNSKIKAVAALAPAIAAEHCSIFIMKKILGPLFSFFGKHRFFYKRGVFSSSVYTCTKSLLPCFPSSWIEGFSGWLVKFTASRFILQVGHPHQLEYERRLLTSQMVPGGLSMKTLCHLMQLFKDGKFQKYNYSRSENQIRYGQETPPSYDLGNVTAPVAIFTAENDYLIPAQDVLQASKQLKNVIFYKNITESNFFHGDFLIGRDAHTLIYQDIVKIFNGLC